MDRSLLLKVILLISLVGLGVAAYQTYEHYYETDSAFCDINEQFSCSVVTESSFGEFPAGSGMATALWGAIWWIALIYLAYTRLRDKNIVGDQEFYLFGWTLAGVGSVVGLVAAELYWIPLEIDHPTIFQYLSAPATTQFPVLCPLCTIQHVLILALVPLTYLLLTRSLTRSVQRMLYDDGGNLKIKPFWTAGTLAFIAIGGFFILSAGVSDHNYDEFATCLADQGATMYGFDACPSCNKQKSIIGKDAFDQNFTASGMYVKCRPNREANMELGDRASMVASVEPLSPSTTQGEACSINVGAGTPTWVIDGEKYVGDQSLETLSELTGCPLPEEYVEQRGGQ